MDHNHMSLDLRGKKIVSVTNGEIIGEVVDVLVDPQERHIAALVTSKGNLFRRETQMLQREDISVIGKHVILSNRPDVVRNREDFTGNDQWVAVSDHLRGNDVVTNDGTRVGRLQDIIVNPHGGIIGYALSNIAVSGPIQESKQIPADSIMSFGKDVVIVDPGVIHARYEPLRTESDRTDIFGREREEYRTTETERPVDYQAETTEGYAEDEDRHTRQREVETAETYPRRTDAVHHENYQGTTQDSRSEEYPHTMNRDFQDDLADHRDESMEDTPPTRGYQKPRFDSDEEERRREDF
jgi:uncharacterized protein YrrD